MILITVASKQITTFQECKDAGGTIGESYPEQCFFRGKTFVNNRSTEDINYVGMTEQMALDQAKEINVPARVVERDGESLPVTMDYVEGRLNLYVKNGIVYRLSIEGADNE
jgi:hypothetical protein